MGQCTSSNGVLHHRATIRRIVDNAFFPDGRFVSQYLINIGYADNAGAFPRLPRFHPTDVARYA